MKIGKQFGLICMAVLCSGCLWAQDSTPSADAQLSADSQKSEREASPRTFFGQPFAGHWTFTSEFSYGQEYDDNVFSSSQIRLSDLVSRISARFTAAVQKKHLRMQIHYYPDYVVYKKYSDRDALSNRLAGQMDYSLSGRTDLTWTIDGARAPGYTGSPVQLLTFGPLVLPVFDPSALQSNTTILNADTGINLTHRFSARDTVSVNMQAATVHFTPANGVPLSTLFSQDSFSGTGTVRWDNEFVPKHKLGLEIGNSYFGFLNPSTHSFYQYVKLRYSQTFGRGFQISAGAGPSRQEAQANPFSGQTKNQSTGYAADFSFSKASERQNIGITYTHGSQLGLTQGSLASDGAALSFMRRFGRKWHTDGSFGYSRSQSQFALLLANNSSYSASGEIGYQARPDLDFTAGYSYMNEMIEQSLPALQDFDRNVYRLGVHYTFQWLTSR